MATDGENSPAAWIERADAPRVEIEGSCSIGRSSSSQIVLASEKVSRRHAVVSHQAGDEYWLMDLGSGNGTYLNGRRLTQPAQLRDGNLISIGDFEMTFRNPLPAGLRPAESFVAMQTMLEIKTKRCWLLLADIESSTKMGQMLSAEELPVLTGRWFASCRKIIEAHGGAINKYLGDGFFAYWHHEDDTPIKVAQALDALKQLQTEAAPRFRIVLHQGKIAMGGGASIAEESLSGVEVNFAFRMEKLAGQLQRPRMMSDAARSQIEFSEPPQSLGRHPLSGFQGDFEFFSF